MIEHAASKAWRVRLVHLKSRNYSRCPSVVGKFNTERCEGSVKHLLGFLTKQKLLFLFGRMHSSMFPCQVECWSGIMHSLGITGHVLPLGREFARLCLWHVFSAWVTKTMANWFWLFPCPPSVKPRLRCVHFSVGRHCLTAQHKPTSVSLLLWTLSLNLSYYQRAS